MCLVDLVFLIILVFVFITRGCWFVVVGFGLVGWVCLGLCVFGLVLSWCFDVWVVGLVLVFVLVLLY